MFYTFQIALQVFSIRASLSYDRPDAVYCAVVRVICSCRLACCRHAVLMVNSMVMLVGLSSELFAVTPLLIGARRLEDRYGLTGSAGQLARRSFRGAYSKASE